MDMLAYVPLFARGAAMTLASWILASSVSAVIGICMGIISCRYLGYSYLARAIRFYTFIAKGIPAYVQILIAYFIIPSIIGWNISGFFAATAALAFCSSGYVTEIIRSGIDAIPQGQWQACIVLGYSLPSTVWRIILPQAVRNVLPALGGEFEQLLKSTSLLATIGVTELTRTGMNIISRELNPLPVYLIIAVIYLFFSALLQGIVIYSERRMRYGNR